MSGFRRFSLCIVCLVSMIPFHGFAGPPDATAAKDEEEFRQLDISEDGVLTGREARDFQKYDADGDKRVTLAEFLAGRARDRGAPQPANDEQAFKQLDTNADGVLSGKERRGYLEYDKDGDGEISQAEFLAGQGERRKSTVLPPTGPGDAPEKDGVAQTYINLKEKLSPRHVKYYIPFRFSFPAGWKYDPKAGTEESSNIVKVEKNLDLGKDGVYTQENFAVGFFDAPGKGELVKAMTQFLCDQLQRQIKMGFGKVQMNEKRDLKFGTYPGYGFDFSFKQSHPTKGEIEGWGRVVLVSADTLKQRFGLMIIMLATSEAPELKSLADLGVKGDLPVIIKSFVVEQMPVKTVPGTPPPTTPPPAPPALPAPPVP